jgi:hypothetical protein
MPSANRAREEESVDADGSAVWGSGLSEPAVGAVKGSFVSWLIVSKSTGRIALWERCVGCARGLAATANTFAA